MTDGYIIQGKFNWGKEILYWSAIDSFHNGRNPKKGYTAYPTKAKANEVIRKLKKLYHEVINRGTCATKRWHYNNTNGSNCTEWILYKK